MYLVYQCYALKFLVCERKIKNGKYDDNDANDAWQDVTGQCFANI